MSRYGAGSQMPIVMVGVDPSNAGTHFPSRLRPPATTETSRTPEPETPTPGARRRTSAPADPPRSRGAATPTACSGMHRSPSPRRTPCRRPSRCATDTACNAAPQGPTRARGAQWRRARYSGMGRRAADRQSMRTGESWSAWGFSVRDNSRCVAWSSLSRRGVHHSRRSLYRRSAPVIRSPKWMLMSGAA